jgi:cytochrome c oxidase assembly protein Cox11
MYNILTNFFYHLKCVFLVEEAYAPESRIEFPVVYTNKWVYKQARIKYNEYVHYIYTVYTIKQTNKTRK